jgi:hypothetical protein
MDRPSRASLGPEPRFRPSPDSKSFDVQPDSDGEASQPGAARPNLWHVMKAPITSAPRLSRHEFDRSAKARRHTPRRQRAFGCGGPGPLRSFRTDNPPRGPRRNASQLVSRHCSRPGKVTTFSALLCFGGHRWTRNPLSEEVHSREIDDFIAASIKNCLQHEKAKALGFLVGDRWRH